MSHTPGPWILTKSQLGVDTGSVRISQSSPPCGSSNNVLNANREMMLANARLIAASPELLDALKDLVRRCEYADWHDKLLLRAKAAIALAEESTQEATA